MEAETVLPDRVVPAEYPFPLQDIPVELIEKIYIYSENLGLPLANSDLYRVLNCEAARLHISSYLFSRSFECKYGYTDCNFAADSQHDEALVKLQTTLLSRTWFNASFARRLESLTPELKARALLRNAEDGFSRGNIPPSDRPVEGRAHMRCVGSIETPRNVHMPERWLIGPWTDEKVEMFHRLRGWYIDPIASRDNEKTVLLGARTQAVEDDRDDVMAELDWYISAESIPVAYCCGGPPVVDEQLLRQYNLEMEEAAKAPLPDEEDSDL